MSVDKTTQQSGDEYPLLSPTDPNESQSIVNGSQIAPKPAHKNLDYESPVPTDTDEKNAFSISDFILSRRFLIFLVVAISAGTALAAPIHMFGFFVVPLEEEFGWTRGIINVSISIGFITSSLLSPFLGYICDRFGGHIHLIVGLVITGGGFVIRAYAQDLIVFYISAVVIHGTSESMSYLAMGKVLGGWFPDNYAIVIGVATAWNNVTAFYMSPITATIIETTSWRMMCLVFAAILGGLAIISLLVVRSAPGTLGKADTKLERKRTLIARIRSATEPGSSFDSTPEPIKPLEAEDELTGLTVTEALHWHGFYFIAAAMALWSLTVYALTPNLVPHFDSVNIDPTLAAMLFSVYTIVGAFTKIVGGFLVKRTSARYVMAGALVFQMAGLAMLILSGGSQVIWFAIIVTGAGTGLYGMCKVLVIKEAIGLKCFGRLQGIVLVFVVIPGLVGPVVSGHIFDVTGSYVGVFVMLIAVYLLSFFLVLAAGSRYKF